MFGISIFEFLVVVVVGVLLVRPKDVSAILYWYKNIFKKVSDVRAQVQEFVDQTVAEAGLEKDGKYILDLEGKLQRAYDVKELVSVEKKSMRSPRLKKVK